MWGRAIAAAICAGLCVGLAAPADAAFPGKNGKLAFSRNVTGEQDPSLWTINPDGTGVARLQLQYPYVTTPAWSPSGTRIAYDNAAILGIANADGSNDQFWWEQGQLLNAIDWSPDETSFVFVDGPDGNGSQGLYTLPSAGFPILLEDNVSYAAGAWSPDGSRIAFQHRFPEPNGIYTMLPDGTGRMRVPDTGTVLEGGGVDWSPDAQRLAFASEQDGIRGIFTVNLDGTDLARVTSTPTGLRDTAPAWSPDGHLIAFVRWGAENGNAPRQLFVVGSDGGPTTHLAAAGDLVQPNQIDWQPIPINAYPRPKGATPFLTYLVPAYAECTTPNRTHGPSLSFGSCNPPTQTSDELTVGSADSNGKPTKSISSVRFETVVGVPSTPADEADVAITAEITDVYTQAGLADYAGELRATTPLRITDKLNTPHPGGPGAGTVSDISYGFTIPCAATADTTIGGACLLSTSADALAPGAVKEGRRAIWGLGAVEVYDANNAPFMKQGIFIP